MNQLITDKIISASNVPVNISTSQNNYAKTSNYLTISLHTVSLTGVLAGQDGEILIIESTAPFGVSAGDNAVIIPNESGSSSAVNRFTSLDGADMYLYFGDRYTFIYRTSTNRWILKEIFRNENMYPPTQPVAPGNITGITWTAVSPPTVDNAAFFTRNSGNLCFFNFGISMEQDGTSVTKLVFDLPKSIPTGAGTIDPLGNKEYMASMNIQSNGVTTPAFNAYTIVSLNDFIVTVVFSPAISNIDTIQGQVVIAIQGNTNF